MRVVVAAQDAKLRTALCVWVGHMKSMELSGVARNTSELIPALRIGAVDLTVLDWDLLAGQDVTLIAQAQDRDPPPRMIVLCWQSDLTSNASELGIDTLVDKAKLPDSLFEILGALG